MSNKNLNLQDLPLEILAHILKFVGNSSFYSFQNVNKNFFEILSSIVKSKVTSSEVLAKKKVEKYKKTTNFTTLTQHEKQEREQKFVRWAYFDIVHNSFIEYIQIDCALLNATEIKRLILHYKNTFDFRLIKSTPWNDNPGGVVLPFQILEGFCYSEIVDFQCILYFLKNINYEADSHLGSIHEIYSLSKYPMEDEFLLKNYICNNPTFDLRYKVLRKYASQIDIRKRTFYL